MKVSVYQSNLVVVGEVVASPTSPQTPPPVTEPKDHP